MKNLWCVVVAGLLGCTGPEGPAGPPGGSPDGGATGPAHAPASIAFRDQDPRQGWIEGTVTVARASDESDLTSYALYFGSSPTQKLYLSPIVVIASTGSDLSFPFAPETPLPTGATHLLAYSSSDAGELATPAFVASIDNYPIVHDLSTSPAGTYFGTSFFVDAPASKLDIVMRQVADNHRVVVRCNLDTTGCVATDTGVVAPSALLTLDAANTKLLLVTRPTPTTQSLYVCNLDGTGCIGHDISAGVNRPAGNLVVDGANHKAVVPVTTTTNGIGVLRASVDGTAPTFTSINADPSRSYQFANVAIDASNAQLIVQATYLDTATHTLFHVALYRCDLDGTSCAEPWFINPTYDVGDALVIDPDSSKVISATGYNNPGELHHDVDLLSGELKTFEVSTSEAVGWLPNGQIVVDPMHAKLFIGAFDLLVTGDTVKRCELDGSQCIDLPLPTRALVTLAIDAANQQLIGTWSEPVPGTSNTLPKAFTLALW